MEIEVLAPIGNYEMATEVLKTDCDAVYLGGKELNMRMHSKVHNFTNEEIAKTVLEAHALGKKVYITVNIMFDNSMIKMASEYVTFLAEIGVDAVIVQDLGMIQLIKDLNLDLEIHASVMANTHTLEQVKVFESLGITRVVLTREVSLATAKYISENSNVELEYFVADNMCPANSALCYFTGVLFGKSSNQGKCMKACRWKYQMLYNDQAYDYSYYLASKDIDMINHVDDMIESGIVSLKIEGRRKPLRETVGFIEAYAKARDNYFKGVKEEFYLADYYRRDRCNGHAYANPQLDLNNLKNEGDDSVIKMFSKRGKDTTVTTNKLEQVKAVVKSKTGNRTLTLKVDNYDDAMWALEQQVDKLYLAAESVSTPLTIDQIKQVVANKGNTKVYLAMTTMQFEAANQYHHDILEQVSGIDGIEASDISQVVKYSPNYEVRCHYTLGQINSKAIKLLTNLGATSGAISIEAKPNQFNDMLNATEDVDVIGYGRLVYMYMDINFYKYLDKLKPIGSGSSKFENVLVLENESKGQNPIYKDQFDKNFLTSEKIFNAIGLIKRGNVIVDARFIDRASAERAVDLYNNKVPFELTNEEYLGTLNHVYKQPEFILEQDIEK